MNMRVTTVGSFALSGLLCVLVVGGTICLYNGTFLSGTSQEAGDGGVYFSNNKDK
jgi:hypothetical protein